MNLCGNRHALLLLAVIAQWVLLQMKQSQPAPCTVIST
jgi:hypothetical protein